MLFMDDFEDGGLTVDDSPPGRWDGFDTVPGTDGGISPDAAHAGARGLRLWDLATAPAQGTTVAPYAGWSQPAGDRYARAWIRFTSLADAGAFTVLQLLSGSRSGCDVNLAFPPGAFLLAGDTAGGSYPVTPTGYREGGGWHLVECGVVDAGTTSTTRVLWVDGVQLARQQVDLTGFDLRELDVGEPWADDGRWMGVIDMDNVAVTEDPPPSLVEADAGGLALVAGQCAPVEARLLSSSRVPAGALWPDRLSLSFDGGPALAFTDGTCSQAGSFIDIDAGEAGATFGLRPLGPGIFTVTVTSTDLVPRPAGLRALGVLDAGIPDGGEEPTDGGNGPPADGGEPPDGGEGPPDGGGEGPADAGGEPPEDAGHGEHGVPDQPSPLLVSCGCSSATAPVALLGALAALAWLSGRRRRDASR